MTRPVLSIVVCIAAWMLCGLPAVFAQSCPAKESEVWMEGTIGESRIRVYLGSHFEGSVDGSYYDLKEWRPVSLQGTLSPDCQLRLKEEYLPDPDGFIREGTWTATFRDGPTVEGIRTSNKAGDSGPIKLEKIARIDCEGKGRWVRFDQPDLPMTFEYPENWRVMKTDPQGIRVVCPDPFIFQIGESGANFYLVDQDVKGLTEYASFTNYQGTWLFNGSESGGSCTPGGFFCEKAAVSNQNGMTVLHGRGTMRLYGASGYAGQGEQESYIFMLPDRWVHLSSVMIVPNVVQRITRSVRPRR